MDVTKLAYANRFVVSGTRESVALRFFVEAPKLAIHVNGSITQEGTPTEPKIDVAEVSGLILSMGDAVALRDVLTKVIDDAKNIT